MMKTHIRENVRRSGEDRDIDRILADSFPASDPPPWTLGVAQRVTSAAGGSDTEADSHRADPPRHSVNE
jgi:hypothetical protein